ncbi:phospholipase [Schizosaccharomyces japonicus yFS275]|uniref:Phospholipase n=1 Tax=Schizosaccharomyces japonicus (strain yFS275 / FY16936) TaxID=402676 RepID=B6JXQ7_SCHJY|nr:phospholipase [Schizosaccharomyces japonicus yFS275]EEB05201.1 phospholipase [Schizosaccharomyces japonicus yFS275]
MDSGCSSPLPHVERPRLPFRHRLSKSVTDAPELRVRWFYAIDRPLKPLKNAELLDKKARKLKPFSAVDSDRLEMAYWEAEDESVLTPIQVNEDHLFAVDIAKRELYPIYWDGPVYRVVRGTWFYETNSELYPCEENLATQIEEGYLHSCPFREEQGSFNQKHGGLGNWPLLGQYTGGFIEFSGKNTAKLNYGRFSSSFFFRWSPSNGYKTDRLVRGYERSVLSMKRSSSVNLSSSTTLPGNDASDADTIELSDYNPSSVTGSVDALGEDLNAKPKPAKHLIFCCHGIGQKMGERLKKASFVYDVSKFRHTLKELYNISEDLQTLIPGFKNSSVVQCLPVLWRQDIRFGMTKTDPLAEEEDGADYSHDLGDDDDMEGGAPTLEDITIQAVVGFRNIISDVFLDVLLYYQPSYREKILAVVVKRLNHVYRLYRENNPDFTGEVSLLGHSLGSVILFDILARQGDEGEHKKYALDFKVTNFFALGSPLGLFQMLNGRRISGQGSLNTSLMHGSLSEEDFVDDTTVLSCRNFYNIFLPTDPISYRVEPLIAKRMAQVHPQPIPSVKSIPGLSTHNTGQRWSFGPFNVWAGLRSGITNSLIKQSLGDNWRTASDKSVTPENTANSNKNKVWQPEEKVYSLNSTGRVDFMLQSASDATYDYSSAMNSHSSYWTNLDLAHFILTQLC